MPPLTLSTLAPLERDAVGLFRRHLVLTPEAVRAWACPGASVDAIRAAGSHLRDHGWLTPPPDSIVDGWTPTAAAAAALELADVPADGFGPDGLIEHLGRTLLCLAAGLRKIDGRAVRETWPELHRPGLPQTGYAVTADDRLAWLVVDHGSLPERVAVKVGRAVNRRRRLPAFRELIDRGAFAVFVGTAEPDPAAAINRALRCLPSSRTVEMQVHVLPELIALVSRRRPAARPDRPQPA